MTELGALWASEGTDLREERADLKVAWIKSAIKGLGSRRGAVALSWIDEIPCSPI